jgi:Uma2 family endonuclease
MSVTTQASPAALVRGGRSYRVTAEVYYRMLAAGVIPQPARVELWDGELVEKMGKNQPHVIALTKLVRALIRLVPDGWHVAPEAPLELDEARVPAPDLMIVRGQPDDYPDRPPTGASVSLVVEVADTSLRKDVGRMRAAYAAAAIPVYWIINLPARQIEIYNAPTGPDPAPRYGERHVFGPADLLPVVLDGREVGRLAVRDLLPR